MRGHYITLNDDLSTPCDGLGNPYPSQIAKILQSARNMTGKKMFEETLDIHKDVSKNNNTLAA
jgi:hypothetical protein